MADTQELPPLPPGTHPVQDIKAIRKWGETSLSGSTLAFWQVKSAYRFFVAWRKGIDPTNRPKWQPRVPFQLHVGSNSLSGPIRVGWGYVRYLTGFDAEVAFGIWAGETFLSSGSPLKRYRWIPFVKISFHRGWR